MDIPEEQGITRNEKGQFVPGVSGNPGGRPEGSVSIMAIIRRKLAENPDRANQIADEILDDPKMRTEIVRQLDGAPRQNIGLDGGREGLPIQTLEITDEQYRRIILGRREALGG